MKRSEINGQRAADFNLRLPSCAETKSARVGEDAGAKRLAWCLGSDVSRAC
jgi:hypothetical protein